MSHHALPPLQLGIAGFGTVGSGLIRILQENKDIITARTGREIHVKTILVRDTKRPRACPVPDGALLTDSLETFVNDPDIDAVVELIGGIDTAKVLIEKALNANKHVVTANKALLAETGNHLFALAAEKGLHLAYEASICGGIPIVQTLREGLAANRIHSLVGILNGTSNYILSEMSTKGLAFTDALKKAQELGYAEADPTLDIGGFDAAHKLALLIRLAWGVEYPYSELPIEGISSIQLDDITYARKFGFRIKLLGQARMVGSSLEACVAPALVHEKLLMARVGGAYNAVRVEGDAVGSLFLHGKGAGDLPTGSAVAADVLAIAQGTLANNTGFVRPNLPKATITPPDEVSNHYYIRLQLPDTPGVLRDVASIMTDNGISIAQAIQQGQSDIPVHGVASPESVPFILMTHEAPAHGVKNALKQLKEQKLIVDQEPVALRIFAKSGSQK